MRFIKILSAILIMTSFIHCQQQKCYDWKFPRGIGDNTASTTPSYIDIDYNQNIIIAGSTRARTTGLDFTNGSYSFIYYASANGQNDWFRVYSEIKYSLVVSLKMNYQS